MGHYYQQVPVVALTANAAPGNREMFLEEGFADFVAKPLEPSVLERVLKRNLPRGKIIYQVESEQGNVSGQEEISKNQPVLSMENVSRQASLLQEEHQETKEFSIGSLDVEQGLVYCGGRESYLEILRACCEEAEENISLLNELCEEEDWKNYVIKVHALKGTMMSIGAGELSGKAKKLEMAGRQERFDEIREGQAELMEAYRHIMQEIRESKQVYPGGASVQEEAQPQTAPASEPEVAETSQESVLQEDASQEGASQEAAELSNEEFEQLQGRMEDAMYDLDGEEMLAVLEELKQYCYHGVVLKERLQVVQRQIEKEDFMQAGDTLAEIGKQCKEGKHGKKVN
jgi:HPt (histidine-containing phosphotransfer) domain-containing protein